mgnify:CR=1 FL=1
MIVCDYLVFVLVLRSNATGERWGPVLRPGCLRARECWSALAGSPAGLDHCEDVELSLGKVFAYDCL